MSKELELNDSLIYFKNVSLEAYPDMASFYCSNHSMDEFLKKESYISHISMESSTTLVYYGEYLAAYFTIQRSKLKIEFEPDLVQEKHMYSIDLARLAVASKYQSKGLGTFIIKKIIELAYRVNTRFITTDALFEYWEWYRRFGFDYLKESEIREDTTDGLVYMLLDLYDPELIEYYFNE